MIRLYAVFLLSISLGAYAKVKIDDFDKDLDKCQTVKGKTIDFSSLRKNLYDKVKGLTGGRAADNVKSLRAYCKDNVQPFVDCIKPKLEKLESTGFMAKSPMKLKDTNANIMKVKDASFICGKGSKDFVEGKECLTNDEVSGVKARTKCATASLKKIGVPKGLKDWAKYNEVLSKCFQKNIEKNCKDGSKKDNPAMKYFKQKWENQKDFFKNMYTSTAGQPTQPILAVVGLCALLGYFQRL